MDDLISRQDAIDALERLFDRCEEIEAHLPDGDKDKTGYKMFPDYMTVWKYLLQDPTIDPAKHGKWLLHEYPDGYYHTECSECGKIYSENVYYIKKPSYCPNCGALMDKSEDV